MRFSVRLGLLFIGVLSIIGLLLIHKHHHASSDVNTKTQATTPPIVNRPNPDDEGDIEDDEAAQILLGSDGQVEGGHRSKITVSVAIVMVVSLLAVALLITGIIVVAITIDPRVPSDENSDIEEEMDDEDDRALIFAPPPPGYFSSAEFDNLFSSSSNQPSITAEIA